jgi:hypothetical protein
MLRQLKAKDKSNFLYFCYINHIENAQYLFNRCIKWGQEANIDDTKDMSGLLLVDKIDKKICIKLYSKSYKSAQNLLKKYLWNCKTILYASLPQYSSLLKVFLRVGFRITTARGTPTIELVRELYKKPFVKKDK